MNQRIGLLYMLIRMSNYRNPSKDLKDILDNTIINYKKVIQILKK
jgi:hypothetical protein